MSPEKNRRLFHEIAPVLIFIDKCIGRYMRRIIHYIYKLVFWEINVVLFYCFSKLRFGTVIKKGSDRIPGAPFIMVSNHGTFFDPWIVGCLSLPPLSIMMNDDGFRSGPVTRWYLKSIGTFPKKKGAHDFKAMKTTIQLLREGYSVLIFPEGQTTWDGETQPIYGGIEKIIKKIRCNVVIMHLEGNFLSKPWWAESYRKGRVHIGIKVIDPKEIDGMSDEKLLETIKTSIYNNDIKNPVNLGAGFKGRNLALGLERFVWMCMECGSEDTLETFGNTIACTKCKNAWTVDPCCRLSVNSPGVSSPGDLKDWAEWHKERVKSRLASAGDGQVITASENVVMQTEGENQEFADMATGRLVLTKKEIRFHGEKEMFFPLENVADCVIQKKDIFEFMCEDKYYRFVFKKHSPMKWVYYLRYIGGYEEVERRGII